MYYCCLYVVKGNEPLCAHPMAGYCKGSSAGRDRHITGAVTHLPRCVGIPCIAEHSIPSLMRTRILTQWQQA